MATAINDFIQGIIMLFGIVAVIAAVLASKGGFMEALSSLAQVEDPSASTIPGAFNSFLGPDPLNLLSVVILTSLGTWGGGGGGGGGGDFLRWSRNFTP